MKKLFLLLSITYVSFGQKNDIEKTDGFLNSLHESNKGKIIFTASNIPLEQLKETDFLETYELNRNSTLNFRVFMDNSITNYLHQLAPEFSAEKLIVSGNYQFSFFVDEKLIYKENLHHGAGLKKHTTTTFRMPLTSTTGEDFWSVYLFDRFKNNGGQKALTNGTHLFKIEIRPYLKVNEKSEVKIGDLIAEGSLNLIIKPTKILSKEIDIQPIMQNIDWEISNEKYDKKLIRELNKNIAENNFKEITSIVVIKNGKLLIEEYFNKAERNTLHDTRSVGKSFASALTGIAIKEGFLKSENQTLSEFYDLTKFQNYTSKKDSISIKNLLTMSSVFDGDDSDEKSAGNEENMYPTDDWVKFTLDLPINKNKQNWAYFTAGVVLLGDILNKTVPEGLEKYADKKLFQPLNIKNYQWQYTPQKVANTAGGLQMTALDYAKFGQLYQQKGKWKNQQILDENWVEKTFTKQFSIPERANEFYGFLFWNKTFQINGKPYETFYCAGNGGSKIYIFKDLPLTIVITSKAFNRPYGHLQVDKMMEDYILKAIFP